MKPRVLLVDDDPIILATHQRFLRSCFDVDAVEGGAGALTRIGSEPPYAVVVVDQQMPRMCGMELLLELQKRAPEAVRIMMTSAEDQQTAMDAVNAGRVSCFLKKPCRPEVFVAAVREAATQYELARRERVLLEQAFSGIVELLTGVLSSAQPESFGQGDKLRERARKIGQAMKLPSTSELETAAMLLRLGTATIPEHVRNKLRLHERLTPSETELVARIPEIGARILDHIPQLASVATIIRHQGRSFEESIPLSDGVSEREVPLAARILHALVDLQILEESGLETEAALLRLRYEGRAYDPAVLKKLELFFVRGTNFNAGEVEECMVEHLVSRMVLAEDAISDEEVPLVAAGTVLTQVLIERLRNFAELGQVRQPLYIVREQAPADTPQAESS